MYPGLVLGRMLEQAGFTDVDYHATTRSPIGLCDAQEYPVRTGSRLPSFYDADRTTFIYDLRETDLAIILTDSPDDQACDRAAVALSSALQQAGCREIMLIREARDVRNI